jgi:hypothetical protein
MTDYQQNGKDDPRPAGEDAAKEGGQGSHWGILFPDLEHDQQPLWSLIQAVAEDPAASEPFDAPAGPGLALYSGGGPLQACVLVDGQNRLVSAFPAVQGGHSWPIMVEGLTPWANGLEGQITGTCHGALVHFFDTRWWANHHRYTVGLTYEFRINGLAYVLRPAEARSFALESGQQASTRGMRAYLPAQAESEEDADIDDYWFQSPLDARRYETFAAVPLTVYTCALALPDDVPLTLDIYAAPHAQSAALGDLPLGEDVSGFLWLQGYLRDA